MEGMVEESDKRVPLICFLSMGSDPTENIMSLAKKMNISKYFKCQRGRQGQISHEFLNVYIILANTSNSITLVSLMIGVAFSGGTKADNPMYLQFT